MGSIVLSMAIVASAHAEAGIEGSPNNLTCSGHISAGTPELGSEEVQVRYTFYCNGPISGYELQSNVPLTGFEAAPLVTSNATNQPLSDTFSCGGELPGWADNCEGSAKAGWETITGQFSIGKALCAAPHLDPLLSVTDIYLEKAVPTQAISGPFDLGRPLHCPASSYVGGTRLEPEVPLQSKDKKTGKHGKGKGKGKKAKIGGKARKK
ncbi:MAG TPA: hypothetical protein VNU24_04040 [Solirubrobacteraceae bacterium]|nr:hypothetical protein [Solirubrobacteraceae bacterium]